MSNLNRKLKHLEKTKRKVKQLKIKLKLMETKLQKLNHSLFKIKLKMLMKLNQAQRKYSAQFKMRKVNQNQLLQSIISKTKQLKLR